MPGGSRFFCLARSITKPGTGYGEPETRYAIGIGCDLSYAEELVYSEGLNWDAPETVVPVGINCRLCERSDCRQRAMPSLVPPAA